MNEEMIKKFIEENLLKVDSYCIDVSSSALNTSSMQEHLRELRIASGFTYEELGKLLQDYENILLNEEKDVSNPGQLIKNIERGTGISSDRVNALFNIFLAKANKNIRENNNPDLMNILKSRFSYDDNTEIDTIKYGLDDADLIEPFVYGNNHERIEKYIENIHVSDLPSVRFGNNGKKEPVYHLRIVPESKTDSLTFQLRLFRLLMQIDEETFASNIGLSGKSLNPYEVCKKGYFLSQKSCTKLLKLIKDFISKNRPSDGDFRHFMLFCMGVISTFDRSDEMEKEYRSLCQELTVLLQSKVELRENTKLFYEKEFVILYNKYKK